MLNNQRVYTLWPFVAIHKELKLQNMPLAAQEMGTQPES